jgi:hypothetical protein
MTRFKPTTAQLELLCEHASARVPAAVTAKALGVRPEDLLEFAGRLARGRAHVVVDIEKVTATESTPLAMQGNRVFR